MNDCGHLMRACALAARSAGHTRPNPPVGAVVVKDGRVVGEGRHRRCGGDHAEVAALKAAGAAARGATVYCTLEPCSTPGRVGACCDALAAAGVKRVVWAAADPNPVNRGRAKRLLMRAGIAAEALRARDAVSRAVVAEAKRLIAPFAKHVATGLPFVTVKIALSLDGRICDDFGAARWISSASSRRATGRLRESADVVLVGAGTVRADDPSLLCRTKRNDDLWRAVATRGGPLPPAAKVFTDAARARTLVLHVGKAPAAALPGVETVRVPSLRAALAALGERGFLHVLCEGGLELARALAAEDLVDEWIAVLAPKVVGHGPVDRAFVLPGADVVARWRKTAPAGVRMETTEFA